MVHKSSTRGLWAKGGVVRKVFWIKVMILLRWTERKGGKDHGWSERQWLLWNQNIMGTTSVVIRSPTVFVSLILLVSLTLALHHLGQSTKQAYWLRGVACYLDCTKLEGLPSSGLWWDGGAALRRRRHLSFLWITWWGGRLSKNTDIWSGLRTRSSWEVQELVCKLKVYTSTWGLLGTAP